MRGVGWRVYREREIWKVQWEVHGDREMKLKPEVCLLSSIGTSPAALSSVTVGTGSGGVRVIPTSCVCVAKSASHSMPANMARAGVLFK